jgi:hypothetical protein
VTRDEVIEKAARELHGSYNAAMEAFNAKRGDDWGVVPFEDSRLFWRGVVEPLAEAGLLAEPEQHAMLERLRVDVAEAGSVLNRVRAALGTPEGQAVSVHAAEVRAERDALQARVTRQEQVLTIVREQTDKCVEEVDAALGHRYHTPGVHYSVPDVARKAAAELRKLEAQRAAALAIVAEVLPSMDLGDGAAGADALERVRAALQGDQPAEQDFAPFAEESLAIAEQTLPAAVEALATVDDKHAYEDDAASNWAGICRVVCSYPPGGPQHLDAPAELTGEADRG